MIKDMNIQLYSLLHILDSSDEDGISLYTYFDKQTILDIINVCKDNLLDLSEYNVYNEIISDLESYVYNGDPQYE